MNSLTRMTENWLTRKPHPRALGWTMFLIFFMCAASYVYWTGLAGADEWMPASGEKVFRQRQYWRLWTALFAHGDAGHLLGNLFLFAPFSYFLLGSFSPLLFPFLALLSGGLINAIVLKAMPEQVSLIGVSGVVYWMGAVWLFMFLVIDRRESLRRRLAKVLFISMVLFVPETYKPETSYLSHFIGYVVGIGMAAAFYSFNSHAILAAEVYEEIIEDDDELPEGDPEGFESEFDI